MLSYIFAIGVGILFAVSAKNLGKNLFIWFFVGTVVYMIGHYGGGIILKHTVVSRINWNDPPFVNNMSLITAISWVFAGLCVLCGSTISIIMFRVLLMKGNTTNINNIFTLNQKRVVVLIVIIAIPLCLAIYAYMFNRAGYEVVALLFMLAAVFALSLVELYPKSKPHTEKTVSTASSTSATTFSVKNSGISHSSKPSGIFFGSGDDYLRHQGVQNTKCLLCNSLMIPAGPFLWCSNGHERLNFTAMSRRYFTASESVAIQLQSQGAHIEKDGEMWYIET